METRACTWERVYLGEEHELGLAKFTHMGPLRRDSEFSITAKFSGQGADGVLGCLAGT